LKPLVFLRNLDALSALMRSVGPPCWATDVTGSALFGFDGCDLIPPFHLAVPRERAPRPTGHHVHRLRDLSNLDTDAALGLPCLSATRLLIEVARTQTPDRLTVMLDCAIRDGLTTEDFLHRRMLELRRPGRAGMDLLRAVMDGQERSRGGHSFLERAFLELLGELGYPRPDTQVVLARRGDHVVRVDCRFPDTSVVVELLGYRHHRSVFQMQQDSERRNALTMAGFDVFEFTFDDVVLRSPQMLATLSTLFCGAGG
jgi:hypothetical protein